eukprot:157925-Amphidinium_carterae.4
MATASNIGGLRVPSTNVGVLKEMSFTLKLWGNDTSAARSAKTGMSQENQHLNVIAPKHDTKN